MRSFCIKTVLAATLVLALLAGCKKDYYQDGGLSKGDYNGTVLQYLQSRPDLFDSLVKVIKYTDMEQVFSTEQITFFAPADSSIRRIIEFANISLPLFGKPAITKIEDIRPAIWKKYLAKYIFKEVRSLKDYPQLDENNLSAFAGQMYTSYSGAPMNIGVIFHDANGVKYAGYRQLVVSRVSSATPRDYTTWFSAVVASADIHPSNGYVHAIRLGNHYFGFSQMEVLEDLIYNN